MKKLFALISIAVALVACSKQEAAPVAAPAAASTASTAAADIPKECQEYLDKVNACASKQSGAARDAIKAGMEQTKTAWANLGTNKAALGNACKAATDAFAAQATAMKC